MTDLEIQEQAEKMYPSPNYPTGYAFKTSEVVEMERKAFIVGAKWMQERDKWISVEEEPNPVEGYYWVVIDGKVQNAHVNEKEYAEMVKQEGFWQYGDCQLDERVFPTHYMPFVLPSPPKD